MPEDVGISLCDQQNKEKSLSLEVKEPRGGPQPEIRKSLSQSSLRKKVTITCMVFTDFAAGVLFSIISPFFPVVAQQKGLSPTSIGVVFSVFEMFIILMAPIWGKLLGKTGAKFTYTTGIIVGAICAMLFGVLYYSPDGSTFLAMCLVSRTLEGAGVAAYMTASYTIAAHTFPDQMNTMFGLLEAAGSTGFMVGPVVGGLVFQAAGYVATLVGAGCLLLLVGLIGAVAVRPDKMNGEGKSGSMLPLLLSIRAIILLMVGVAVYVSIAFFTATLALHLQMFHLTPVQVGAVFLAGPGAYGLCTPFWGMLADKFPQHRRMFMLVGVTVAGCTFFFLGPAPFLPFIPNNLLWIIPLCLLVHGLFASSVVIIFCEVCQVSQDLGMPDDVNTQGLVSGLITSTFSAGGFVGPIVGGSLFDAVGFPLAATVIGFIMLAAALLLIIHMAISGVKRKRREDDEETKGLLADQRSK